MTLQGSKGASPGRKGIPKTVQQRIYDMSSTHTIGHISKKLLISRPTVIKYANPEYL